MSDTSEGVAHLAVLGAGAWGTVLASLLRGAGHDVRLWARRPEQVEAMARAGENAAYLPGVPLPAGLTLTAELGEALEGTELALVAVPSRSVRALADRLPERPPPLVLASKGIEPARFLRLSQVVLEARPASVLAVLSGPNLAAEIAAGKPAGATVASASASLARRVQALFDEARFRVYTATDVVGVEVAGAMKNVIAVAAGICDGLGLGDNAKALILTRGLAEIVRLGTRLGGEPRTFYGLSGVGDLVATCVSAQSRNHLAGVRFARGATLDELEAERLTAEGLPTAAAVHHLGAELRLDLPISAEVYRVAFEGKRPRDAIRDLMARGPKAE
ncbi:MAG TPA: NAD(P)H-dependent glycerol-3-phosphate dehydrogenase [Trueperaceae bacterium]|nr:NAD(P)H-dependent glycerol-3-phosphate dehydrogenase [Trueperaceae bacterium]